MLLNIHVKNMALIDEADIDLTEGLNILTGETGAGKSIIIGSVNVALGLAGFKGFAREDAAFALAELVFSVDNERQRKALERLDIPMEDDQIIISRRLINGRSVSKVNGETVPVSLVRSGFRDPYRYSRSARTPGAASSEESSGDSRCLCRGGALEP